MFFILFIFQITYSYSDITRICDFSLFNKSPQPTLHSEIQYQTKPFTAVFNMEDIDLKIVFLAPCFFEPHALDKVYQQQKHDQYSTVNL